VHTLDSIHGSVLGPGGPISVTGFDFDEVDRNLGLAIEDDDLLPFSEVVSGWVKLLAWILSTNGNLASSGARAAVLQYYLNPNESEFGSLQEIAEAAGVTRAALSAALLDLRKALDLKATMGKRDYCREVYSDAQKAAMKAGVHSSHTRKDSRAKRADAEKPAPAVSD